MFGQQNRKFVTESNMHKHVLALLENKSWALAGIIGSKK